VNREVLRRANDEGSSGQETAMLGVLTRGIQDILQSFPQDISSESCTSCRYFLQVSWGLSDHNEMFSDPRRLGMPS